MEVILKKTKITKSIVNQLEHVNIGELDRYAILGYCVLPKKKIVLLYDSESKRLVYFPLALRVGINSSGKVYWVSHQGTTSSTRNLSPEQAAEVVRKLERIVNNARSLGQIFI